ncbi:MAG TPA: hypothetical protein EYH09_01340 [Candidatus Nanopusillus sp.]|nr:hypothetical protein [Candidatus Nanopusillus sp.]
MRNLLNYEVVGFYYCENNIYSRVDESEIFYNAYGFLENLVETNIESTFTKSSAHHAIIPQVMSIDTYLKMAKKFKEHYVVRLRDRSLGSIKEYRLSPRRDSGFLDRLKGIDGFLTKIPAAILLESTSNKNELLVLREARLYNKNSHVYYYWNKSGKMRYPVIDSVSSIDRIFRISIKENGEIIAKNKRAIAMATEYILLLIPEWHKLDLIVASQEGYKSELSNVDRAYLVIRNFYPLLESSIEDLGMDSILNTLYTLAKRQVDMGIILGDFGLRQVAATGEITDPELAIISASYRKAIGGIYKTEDISERCHERDYNSIYLSLKRYIITELLRKEYKHEYGTPKGIELLRTRLKDIKNIKHVPRKLEEIITQY